MGALRLRRRNPNPYTASRGSLRPPAKPFDQMIAFSTSLNDVATM